MSRTQEEKRARAAAVKQARAERAARREAAGASVGSVLKRLRKPLGDPVEPTSPTEPMPAADEVLPQVATEDLTVSMWLERADAMLSARFLPYRGAPVRYILRPGTVVAGAGYGYGPWVLDVSGSTPSLSTGTRLLTLRESTELSTVTMYPISWHIWHDVLRGAPLILPDHSIIHTIEEDHESED